ncbi:unnamed protein product, partial [Closterium sp. NIES-54]
RAAPPSRAAPPTEPRRSAEPRCPAEPRHPTEPRCPTEPHCPACTTPAATSASTTTAATPAMASPTVLTFDAKGRAVDFVMWWTTRDAVARLAVRSHLPSAERAHFGQYKTAQSLYDAVVARYSSPATAALSHLMLPYLFPDLAAFATVADLITHLRTSDAAALGASASAAQGIGQSAAPGAGESALSGTAPTEALHTFTLDSGASRSFFRDSTTLMPLSRPVAVSLADPSRGPVLAHSSTVLPCPATPSGLLSGLHLRSFSTNLVSGADLQDVWVAVSSQVFAAASKSSPTSAPCSCRPLSHETLLWHHRLGGEFSFCVCTQTEVRRIGMVMDVARTSMIHAAAPHFLWPFAVQYAAHQINLQPRVSLPETTPTLSCPPVPFPASSLAPPLTHPGGSSTTPPRVVFCPLMTSRLTSRCLTTVSFPAAVPLFPPHHSS